MSYSQNNKSDSRPSVGLEGELVHQTTHDMSQYGLVVTISLALEEAANIDSTDIISDFADYADPDSINRLFRVPEGEARYDDGIVILQIEEFYVVIHSHGDVEIYQS